jgi:glycosyltransferase involved in cell wall biosynthesis
MATINPTFGIVIPVYNGEKYIEAAIRSVLEQDVPPDQFVVFNNSSTDGTKEILERMSALQQFEVIEADTHHPRMVDSWNESVKLLTTDWFHLLSADDLLRRSFVSTFRDYLDTECAAISMLSDDITEKGTLKLAKLGIGSSRVIDGQELVVANLWTSKINVASVAIRRAIWDNLGGYPSNFQYLHDLVFWQSLAGNGGVLKVKKVVARYRVDNSAEKGSPRYEGISKDFRKLIDEMHPILADKWGIEIAREPNLKSRSLLRGILVLVASGIIKFAYNTRIVRW